MEKKELFSTIQNSISKNLKLLEELKKESEDQLFFKPDANVWSAIECLEHMNLTYNHYLPRMIEKINRILEKNKKDDETSYKSGILGNILINSMTLNKDKVKLKMKTLKKTTPEMRNKESSQTIGQLEKHIENLQKYLFKSEKLNWSTIKIDSLVGRAIRFKLGDCFMILTTHDYRHLTQARKALQFTGETH